MRAPTPIVLALAVCVLALGAWWLRADGAPRPTVEVLGPASAPQRELAPAGEPASLVTQNPRTRAAPEPRASAGASLVVGRLVDFAGGSVVGATVHVGPFERTAERLADPRAHATASGTTDADGRFELRAPACDTARLAARAPGFAPRDEVWRAAEIGRAAGAPREVHDLGDLVLDRGAVLIGHVRDPRGSPVAGAEVLRLDPTNRAAAVQHAGLGELVARSGEDGGFRLAELAGGPWRLLVRASAHPDATFDGAEAGTAEVPLERTFVLAPGATLAGVVLGAEERWAELEVRAASEGVAPRAAPIGADGRFVLSGLPPAARHTVALWPRGADPSAQPVSQAVDAPSGATDVVLRLELATSIELRAVDAATGAPVRALEVHLVDESNAAAPPLAALGPDGRTARDFPDGRVAVPVRRPASDRTFAIVIWGAAHAPRVLAGLQCTPGRALELGDVALAPVEGLVCRVVDAGGAPVAGAVVRADVAAGGDRAYLAPLGSVLRAAEVSPWRVARTDADGEARLSGVPRAGFALIVERAGSVPLGPLALDSSAAGEVRLQLGPQ